MGGQCTLSLPCASTAANRSFLKRLVFLPRDASNGQMPDALPQTAASGLNSRWPESLRALRHRNYQLFFAGQLISLIGTWMDQIAESWLVYRLTGSALLLGTVAFASQIPVFLLAPIGGALADRFDRRKILIFTQSSMMFLTFILAWVTLSHRVKIWQIVTLAALTGVVNAIDLPARQAFVVDMVSRADLVNAIALNSSMFNGARIVGPALAGIVVAAIGEGWCFFANGISFLAVIAGLAMMKIDRPRMAIEGSPLENIIEGFKFVAEDRPGSCPYVAAWSGQLHRHALCRAHAAFCRPDSPWRSSGARLAHGLFRSGRSVRGGYSGHAEDPERAELLGGNFMRRIWLVPIVVFVLADALALRRAAGPCRILHDDPDGVFQHADSEHGSRPPARTRDVCLRHDVYGDGATGRSACRQFGPQTRCADDCRNRRRGGDYGSCSLRVQAACYPVGGAGNDCGPADGRRRPPAGDDRLQKANNTCVIYCRQCWKATMSFDSILLLADKRTNQF